MFDSLRPYCLKPYLVTHVFGLGQLFLCCFALGVVAGTLHLIGELEPVLEDGRGHPTLVLQLDLGPLKLATQHLNLLAQPRHLSLVSQALRTYTYQNERKYFQLLEI